MGKKIKGGNPTKTFQEISQLLQKKHFSQAAAILRKTKFPPKEKKKADQLNIDIHYYWALAYFEEKEYLRAITTLRMFVERFKKKIKLPLEKANMLLGLSYLYTNDFVKAATYLATAKNTPATQPFYFYYLLSLVYQKKYEDLVGLTADHEKELNLLTEDQKSYLTIAIALVQSNFEQAKTLLADYNANDKNIADNINSLKAILEETTYQATTPTLKPLYKSFLKLNLSDIEKQYLAKIPGFKEQVVDLKNDQLQEDLVIPLQKLCEEGKSLARWKFERCMEMPEIHRPYIVYNQVAALYNEDIEDEENEYEMVAIIKKYERHFFQMPEAIFLFAQIMYWNPENFTPTFFWRNLEHSLDRFGQSFTPLQLNRLSWRIAGCLEDPDPAKKRIHNSHQYKLAKAYPQMLGMKWGQIDDYVFAPDSSLLDSSLDIFTYANFQYGSHIARDKWENGLEGLYPDPSLIASFLGHLEMGHMINESVIENHLDEVYTKILNKAQTFLTKATTAHQIHLKNKVVLDLFKMTHQSMNKFEKDRGRIVGKTKKAKFFDAYYQMIVLFEEDQADSEYLQDYQLLENAPKINHLTKVIKTHKKEKELIDLFQNHLAAGESNLIHQVLLDNLRYTHLIDEALDITLIYFKVLIDKGDTALADIVQNFGNLYIKRLRLPYVPNFPDSNFFHILEQLIKGKMTIAHITTINTLATVYLPFITRTVEPLYYNMAEKLLSYFIKVKKKQPNFAFNQLLIQELKKFVKEAVEERKLKKLGTTLANAEKMFP